MATYWNIKVENASATTIWEGYVKVESNVVIEAYNYNFNRNTGEFPDSNPSNIASWTNCLVGNTYYSSQATNNASASLAGGGGNYAGLPVNDSFNTAPGGSSLPGPQFDNGNNATTGGVNWESGAFGLPLNGFILDFENPPASGQQYAVKDNLGLTSVTSDTGYGNPNYFQIVPQGDNVGSGQPGQATNAFSIQNPYSNFDNVGSYYTQQVPISDAKFYIVLSASALGGDPSCFLENTSILCFSKTLGQEKYLPIQTLRVGDLVKTYKNGYRPIQNIGKSYMFNDPHIWNCQLYVLKKTEENGLLEDVVMTGGHGIMVDNYTDDILKPYARNFVAPRPLELIDNKALVVAAEHKDTVGYTDTNFYTVYHLTLDNDSDEHKRFCIWANGMLSETPSEYQYKANGYIDLNEEHYYQIENGIPEEKEKADKELAMTTFKMRINSHLKHHRDTEEMLENEIADKQECLRDTQEMLENEIADKQECLNTVRKRTEGYTRKVTPILELFNDLEQQLKTK